VTPQYARALDDIWTGISNWPMWMRLGWLEIRRRYRRTAIGPFWTGFNLATTAFAVGFLWAALFNQPVSKYMPFLTAGIIAWQFIAAVVGEGATVFTSGQSLLTTMRISQTLLVATMVWRNVLVFFHNLAVFVVVMLVWKVPLTWNTLLLIPGLALLALNGLWVGILVGIVCTRFRDIAQVIVGLLQILMFLTPVMWSRDMLKGRETIGYLIDINPFYHVIEIVRAPMLGQAPSIENWIVAAMLIVVGGAAALYMFSRFRQRVPYWL